MGYLPQLWYGYVDGVTNIPKPSIKIAHFHQGFPRLELSRQIHRVAPKARCRRGHFSPHGGVHAVRAQQVVVAQRGASAGDATPGGEVHLPKSGGLTSYAMTKKTLYPIIIP